MGGAQGRLRFVFDSSSAGECSGVCCVSNVATQGFSIVLPGEGYDITHSPITNA